MRIELLVTVFMERGHFDVAAHGQTREECLHKALSRIGERLDYTNDRPITMHWAWDGPFQEED